MTMEEFEQCKIAVRNEYQVKIVNQAQRFESYWEEINDRRYHFGKNSAKVNVLDSLNQEDLLKFFEVPTAPFPPFHFI